MARGARDRGNKSAKLGRGKRWATAIDLGSYSVKIATLGVDDADNLSVSKITVEPLPPKPEGTVDELSLDARRTEALKKALSRHGALRGKVILGLSRGVATVRYITLPSADPNEIRTMLFYDIERHVPFPVEALEIDFEVLQQTGEHETLIMMVSALREEIMSYLDICAEAGVRPDAVDIDVFGACTAYGRGTAPETTDLIIDLGRMGTNLGIVSQGKVLFSRNLPIAEQRLLEFFGGANSWQDLGSRFTALAALPAHERGAIEDWFNRLSMEVMRSVSAFRCESYGRPVDRLLLCGGAGFLPSGPSNALSVRLRTNAIIQPPLNGELPPSSEYHGTELASAIGMGLRALQPEIDHINLIPKDVVKERQAREKKNFLINVMLLAALGLGMLATTGYLKYREKADEIAQLKSRYDELAPLVKKYAQMEKDIKTVENYLDHEHSCMTVFYNIIRALPDTPPKNVSLAKYDFEKGKDLTISGQIRSHEWIDEVWNILNNFQNDTRGETGGHAQLFESIELKSSSAKMSHDNIEVWDFEFRCKLKSNREDPRESSRRNR